MGGPSSAIRQRLSARFRRAVQRSAGAGPCYKLWAGNAPAFDEAVGLRELVWQRRCLQRVCKATAFRVKAEARKGREWEAVAGLYIRL